MKTADIPTIVALGSCTTEPLPFDYAPTALQTAADKAGFSLLTHRIEDGFYMNEPVTQDHPESGTRATAEKGLLIWFDGPGTGELFSVAPDGAQTSFGVIADGSWAYVPPGTGFAYKLTEGHHLGECGIDVLVAS